MTLVQLNKKIQIGYQHSSGKKKRIIKKNKKILTKMAKKKQPFIVPKEV